MPNQKGTTANRSKSSKNLTESPKKISSTSSADKQSSATSNKRPLSTQKLEAPGDTFGPKVALVEETAIGYVHNLSNPRRNRGNTLDYCTFLLQTATKNVEPLLYSPHKRPLLLQSQERHAPIKLTYFTYTQAKDKIIVNDMTNISTPQQSEYSFQHQTPTEPQAANTKVLDVLNTSKQWEVVTVQGKIFGLKDQRIVGSPRKKLRLVEAFLDDGSGIDCEQSLSFPSVFFAFLRASVELWSSEQRAAKPRDAWARRKRKKKETAVVFLIFSICRF